LSLRGRTGFGIRPLLIVLVRTGLGLSLRCRARFGLRAILLLGPWLDGLRNRVYLRGPGLILRPVLLLVARHWTCLLLLAGLNLCRLGGLRRVDVIVVGANLLLLAVVNLVVAVGARLIVARMWLLLLVGPDDGGRLGRLYLRLVGAGLIVSGLGLVSATLLRRLRYGHGVGDGALDVAIGLNGPTPPAGPFRTRVG